MDAINFLHTLAKGEVYTWAHVLHIHRIRNGVYHRNGRLISLLTDFGRINPCYPDQHGSSADTIIYTGSGRHGDQKLDPANRALITAADNDAAVPLFNKLSVGRWQFLGHWTVSEPHYVFDEQQNRMLWKFVLRRTECADT